MYKIDRRGGGVQKSYTWTDPKYVSDSVIILTSFQTCNP